MELWFTRYEDSLWCVSTKNNEAPTRTPTRVRRSDTAADVLRRYREKGYKISLVGICPPDMLGLESLEV